MQYSERRECSRSPLPTEDLEEIDGMEDEEDALLRRYLAESYWLATAHQWDKAFSHLAEMGRLLGSATLETLDLNSLYWVDVEVSAS